MKTGRFFKLVSLLAGFILISCTQQNKSVESSDVHPLLQMKAVPSGLGVNIHFYEGNEKDYSMIDEAGIDIVRMDILWERIEKEPGVYNFSEQDKLLADLQAHHLRLLFILCYNNPLYDDGLSPHSDECRAAYARFCEAAASHFADKGIIWELWNEPNSDNFWKPTVNVSDYLAWCKAVVPVIRKADPGACIVGPATSNMDIPFLEAAFEKGLLELVDGVSVHPYRNPGRGPETTYEEYENIKVLIDLYKPIGKNIPLISGEWGYSCFFVSPELQGKYLVRQWLSNISMDVPISIWYDWHDDGTDPQNAEFNFGTVTNDYQPKPAIQAMKNLIAQHNGYQFIGRLSTPDDLDYLLLFSNGDKYQLAAWTTGNPHEIKPGEGIQLQGGTGMLGKNIQPEPGNAVGLTDAPEYFPLEGAIPGYVKLMKEAAQSSASSRKQVAAFILGDKTAKSDFAETLKKYLKNGSNEEKAIAWQILVKVAKSVENGQEALRLYDRILNGDADNLVKRAAMYRIAVSGDQGESKRMEEFLYQPEFAGAACVYFMQSAYKLAGEKKFDEALESLFKATKVTGLRYGPERIFRKLKEMGWTGNIDQKEMANQNGFVTGWNITTPYPNEVNGKVHPVFRGDEVKFEPTKTLNGEAPKWTKVETNNIWGIIPLAEMFGKTKATVFARHDFSVNMDTKAIFKAGTNDGVACWINGRKVFENYVDRALTIDEDVFPVELKKGTNQVLMEIPNSGGNWEFCLRICDSNGLPLMQDK